MVTIKNRFYSATAVIGKRRPWYRTRLNSEYDKEKWGFTGKEQLVNEKLLRDQDNSCHAA